MNTIDVSLNAHSIEVLPLSVGTIKFLRENGVLNLYELFKKTQDDFMRMRVVYESGSTRVLGRKELHFILVAIEEYKNKHLKQIN